MEFFQRCSDQDEEVRDMDKLPYSSSSSSSSSRWGMQSQFYDASPRFSYHHHQQQQHHHGYEGSVSNNENKRGEEVVTDCGGSGGVGSSSGGGGGGEEVVCIEREHMFDKVVTPSDVGKLNRLVIPKQHAEKYFPLDSTANEKGLLLNFEDRSGKPWRFRYSYWNSSQSYVMTKGWSRFVKEKKLYAGDIVSFERGAGESVKDRLYIDWRRRADVQDHPALLPPLPLLHPLSLPRSAPWGGLIMPQNMSMPIPPRDEMAWQRMNYTHHHHLHNLQRNNYNVPSGYNVVNSGSGPIFYLRSSAQQQVGLVQGGGECRGDTSSMVFNSVPVVHGKASAKRVRLFGVNLDCPIPENPEYQFLDSTSTTHSTIASHIPQIPHSIPPLQLSLYNNDSSPSESPKENTSMSLDLDM